MESIVQKITNSKYDGVCIETQHGKIRVNHSFDEVDLLFKELMQKSKRKEIGISFKRLSDDSISDKVKEKCVESAIAISKGHNYDVSWIPNQPNFLKVLPLHILNTTTDDCFELVPSIIVQRYTNSFYKVEFLHGQRRWVVELNESCEEMDLKKLESDIYFGKVKLARGIICVTKPHDEICVQGAGYIWKLNTKSLFEREYKVDEKVLGFVVDNTFNLCHEFELLNGEKHFGYIVNNGFGSTAIRVRLIDGFNSTKFDPYYSSYNVGEEKVFQKESIKGFYDEKTERE